VDVTELDRALGSTRAILASVQPGQLDAPTPCASWDVRALINHFIGTARWWAGVVDGQDAGAGADDAAVDYAAGDYVAAYTDACKVAVAALGAQDVPGRMIRLPFGEFPGAVVIAMAALDQFTHGWDLARAAGQPTDLDPGLARELLARSEALITDDFRGPDGAAYFGPATQAPPGASAADRLAAFLGRAV
jgi:uncharacterized protein (TIGR03086 family)